MKEVNIEIERVDLLELGVEQPTRYAPFRFNEAYFAGYWISQNDITHVETIVFYVANQVFNCKYCKKNIDIFESILK